MYKYFICNSGDIEELEKFVNEKLADGYLLAGNLVIEDNELTWFYQPMIKTMVMEMGGRNANIN